VCTCGACHANRDIEMHLFIDTLCSRCCTVPTHTADMDPVGFQTSHSNVGLRKYECAVQATLQAASTKRTFSVATVAAKL
jgi:hypothetical protein